MYRDVAVAKSSTLVRGIKKEIKFLQGKIKKNILCNDFKICVLSTLTRILKLSGIDGCEN